MRENAGREVVDAGKGVFAAGRRVQAGVGGTDLAGLVVHPAHQAHIVPEKQVPAGFPFAYYQGGQGVRACLPLYPSQVQVGDDIYVVHQEGLVRGQDVLFCMQDAAAGFQEGLAFVGDGNGDAPVAGGNIGADLLREMVHVHGELGVACRFELLDDMVQERFPAHGDQGLGQGVGEGPQAGAQPGGKNKSLHVTGIFLCCAPGGSQG